MKAPILLCAALVMLVIAFASCILGCGIESEVKKDEPFVMPQDQHGVHCWGECWVHHADASVDANAMDAGEDG